MRLLRVCFVVESGTDVRLADGLAERFGLTVVGRTIDGGTIISHPPALPSSMVTFPAGRARFGAAVLLYLLRQRDRYDVVLVQGYGVAALAANVAARITGVPTLMLVCSPAEAYFRCRRQHPSAGKPFRRAELCAIRMLARANAAVAHGYIALSQYLRGIILEHRTTAPVYTIPIYGVDTSLYRPPAEPKMAVKARLGLPTSGSLVFFSSRVAPEKDSETLLAAVRILVDSGRELWLLHRSGGYRMFAKRADDFGLRDRTIATDASHPHGPLVQDYQAADLCVQASKEEGLGFSPLEALSCGVPVIAAAVGGLRETIQDGRTGWTYPVGDPQALAKRIEVVLDAPAEAAKLAEAGRVLVCAEYERIIVFDRLEAVLRNQLRTDCAIAAESQCEEWK